MIPGWHALATYLAGLRDGSGVEDTGPADATPSEPAPVARIDYLTRDISADAAKARYDSGRVKLTRYPRVKLSTRRVVVVMHQMGVVRAEGSSRWPLVTGHRVVTAAGTRLRLFPLDVRLVAANRLDRAPWHAISIELAGNFEEVDGNGKFWHPDVYGRSRASDEQLEAAFQEVCSICDEVQDYGAVVEAIVPHRVSGIDKKGNPNKPLCPGSRVWSEVGERAGAELGLKAPPPGWHVGGTPIPESWRSDRWKPTRFL